MKARLKGSRKLRRDAIMATITDADKAVLREYRVEMFTVPGKPSPAYKLDDGFYLETLKYLREDWDDLETKANTQNPSIEQMWSDVKADVDKPRTYYLPHLEGIDEGSNRKRSGEG